MAVSSSCKDRADNSSPEGSVLEEGFYDQECTELARALLGQTLVSTVGGERVSGRIVEVESYLGVGDTASHSCNGKRTPRNEPMYMAPGTSYVYTIYGMYYCFNISSRGAGNCVLIRALEPQDGQATMETRRLANRKRAKGASAPNAEGKTSRSPKKLKPHELCNGPSKLCTALGIDKATCNKAPLPSCPLLHLEAGLPVAGGDVVTCKRIGIASCGGGWADAPLRVYQRGTRSVSVRDKLAECQG